VFDVVIAGAGLIGMLTARELRAGGLCVALVERGEPAREATWAGGGIISPLYPWRYPDAVNDLARWSQGRYAALCQALHDESGVDPEYLRNGLVICDGDVQETGLAWAERVGARIARIDRSQLRELEPELALNVDSALWMPDIAQVRNPRIGRALAIACARSGIEMITGCDVQGIQIESGQAAGLITAQRGVIRAGAVVVASGAWSGGLLATSGLQIPVMPVRGQMILYDAPAGFVRRVELYKGHYIIPRKDGHTLVGSTLEYVGFEKGTTQDALRVLRDIALELIPALAGFNIKHQWSGLRPGSPDGVPCIGPHPTIAGLYINSGHFRNGVVMGPASARLLVDQLLGREPILAPVPYLPATFAAKPAGAGI